MERKLLAGKSIIITGASRGIGKATALMLAREGAEVTITGRDGRTLAAVQQEVKAFGGVCHWLAGDGEDVHFPVELVAYALEKAKKVDGLVCCAGIALRTASLAATVEEWEQVMRVNLTTPMLLAQQCIPLFKQQQSGKIVFISSTAAKSVNLGATPSYGASKAGVVYLTRHLAQEFAKDRIYVNAVCPGPVDTEITKTWSAGHRQNVMASLPLGTMGEPEDIANAVLFLVSDMSDYVTGESIMVNGGKYMD